MVRRTHSRANSSLLKARRNRLQASNTAATEVHTLRSRLEADLQATAIRPCSNNLQLHRSTDQVGYLKAFASQQARILRHRRLVITAASRRLTPCASRLTQCCTNNHPRSTIHTRSQTRLLDRLHSITSEALLRSSTT